MSKTPNIFKELRESYTFQGEKISIRKFATLIDISHTHISEIERSTRPPSQSELKKYHNFFKVSYEYLLGETKEPTSADVFRENPVNESLVSTRIRLLQESDKKSEKEMLEMINYLIGEEKGLLALYYLWQWKKNGQMYDSLLSVINDIRTDVNHKYSYTELRMIYDNIKKEP